MKVCNECSHCGSDPDGLFCGHPESFKMSSGFGLNLHVATGDDGPCGRDLTLFKQASDEDLKARGLM